MITTSALTRRFGTTTALAGVTLDVPRGEMFALIGPDGAGKTTFFRLVAGVLAPTSGTVVRGTGTFHETWTVRWRPELAVAVIDAARWGTTVVTAATAKIIDTAGSAAGLAAVTAAVEQVLLADLPDALGPVLRALDERAAAEGCRMGQYPAESTATMLRGVSTSTSPRTAECGMGFA